jgi:hypothetical protein
MSDAEIAEYVRPHQLTVKLAIDGTRRHYLLHHPNPTGVVTDLMAYSAHSIAPTTMCASVNRSSHLA